MADEMMVKELEEVVVRFSGDSGDGMQLAGNITVLSAIRLRKERRAYRYAKRVFSPIRRKYP